MCKPLREQMGKIPHHCYEVKRVVYIVRGRRCAHCGKQITQGYE